MTTPARRDLETVGTALRLERVARNMGLELELATEDERRRYSAALDAYADELGVDLNPGARRQLGVIRDADEAPRCPHCRRVMTAREAGEQGACNDCHGGAYDPKGDETHDND